MGLFSCALCCLFDKSVHAVLWALFANFVFGLFFLHSSAVLFSSRRKELEDGIKHSWKTKGEPSPPSYSRDLLDSKGFQ